MHTQGTWIEPMAPTWTAAGDATGLHLRAVEVFAWALAIGCMALHASIYRFAMINLDGISYLELAGAWRDGRFSDALSPYWSPLYPLVLAAALALADPAPYWEYPLVHAVNTVIGVAALAAFTYCVRGFAWPSQRLMAAAYALFLWSAITLLVVWMESPDVLLATWIYLAAGARIRIARHTAHGGSPHRTGNAGRVDLITSCSKARARSGRFSPATRRPS